MGISNLLPLLADSTRACHISEFRGKVAAVDSYCWLHKGARPYATQLLMGEKTTSYLNYALKNLKLLISCDIKPIMVFDGRYLVAKTKTEIKRAESRKQARQTGLELLRLGKKEEAHKYFAQCVKITPNMAHELIKACRNLKVDCIVAPYEADGQLAYFSIKGIADVIVSEDSDLLMFGCKRVMYKMDVYGWGQLVENEKLYISLKMKPDKFTLEKFRHMCILSGCDYVDSLPGIGLKKALKFISMTAETNPSLFLRKLPSYLKMKQLTVTDDYKLEFLRADATFKHMIVFNPFSKQLVRLNPVDSQEFLENAGTFFNDAEALQLAYGNLDPDNMNRIDNWDPCRDGVGANSIWATNYKPFVKTPKSPPKPLKCRMDFGQLEELNAAFDDKVRKELEFYKTPKVEVSETVTREKTETQDKTDAEEQTSPILACSNPFVKKKISKFQLNQLEENKTVISRFFSSQVFEKLTPRQDEMFYRSSTSIASESSEMDEDQEMAEENEVQDENMPLVECILEEGEGEVKISPVKKPLTSADNSTSTSVAQKRRAVSPLPLLAKKFKKQLTITEMFKKQ